MRDPAPEDERHSRPGRADRIGHPPVDPDWYTHRGAFAPLRGLASVHAGRDDEEGAMSVPAGWYDDGSGRQRWWDGQQWTEHYAPADQAAPGGDADAAQNPDAAQTADAADASAQPDAAAADAAQGAYAPPTASGYGDPNQTAAYPVGAPVAGDPYAAPADPYAAPGGAYGAPGYGAAQPAGPKKTPVLGFIGLGLAVLGTILACIPLPVTFGIGMFLLFAALVVSIIAVFQKNTKKWPSITGIILSILGGIIGITIFVIAWLVGVANTAAETFPTEFTSEAPIESPTDSDSGVIGGEGRPSTDEVETGLREIIASVGQGEAFTDEHYQCYAQYFVDSDIPDDTLWTIASGEDALMDMDAAGEFSEKFSSGMTTCLMP